MKGLSPRLKEVATFVRKAGTIADIGTDHAYLPIYLIKHGVCKKVIASDLRAGPLENARTNVEEAGMSDSIELRLSDGLEKYLPDEVDDIVIAGMGGPLIAEIIKNAAWLKNGKKHIVLQPMAHVEYLRDFLVSNGYEILRESVCEDTGKLYCIMSVAFTGRELELPKYYKFYGELPKSADRLSRVYLQHQADRLARISKNMFSADDTISELYSDVAQEIKNILG